MSAGMSDGEAIPNEMRVVRCALRALGYENAYDVPVSPRACCEPIVVSMTDWERETLQADGSERGRRELIAHVCCDDWGDARVTAREVSWQLRGVDWAHVVAPETARVPGRSGLVLLSADVEPLELKVRLFLDAPDALTVAQRSEVRRTLRAWLLFTDDAELVVPGEPELTWHDAVCTGVSDWTSLFADGQAVVTFECLDPIAYGASNSSSDDSFTVGGTWETWSVIELVAEEGSSVSVGYSEIE